MPRRFRSQFSGNLGRKPVVVRSFSVCQCLRRAGLALCLAALIVSSPVLARAQSGTVYSADEGARAVSIIDLASGQARQLTVPIAPHNVDVSPDGRWLAAVGVSGALGGTRSLHRQGGRLVLLPAQSPTENQAVVIGAGTHPAHVVFDRDGTRAFVTDSARNRVVVIDLVQRQEIGTIVTGSYPHGLRLSPDGRQLLVANMMTHSVSFIDVASLQEVARIQVGRRPIQVAYAPDGRTAYVSLSGEDRIAVLNVVERRLARTMRVGRRPVQLSVTPNGRLLVVANQGSARRPGRIVSLIELSQMTVAAEVTTGRGPYGVAIDPTGARAYVTSVSDGMVAEVDLNSRSVARTFRVGAGPNGIALRP